ncbi:zinc-dependent metalloprotease family protein [Haloferax sp. DFSO60]|uniref:zinc-dependent metalloprotease family protein n=1 Tax=Haloferax sp. DFSO60 TaxID=3388652 RepID=UPI00397BAE78
MRLLVCCVVALVLLAGCVAPSAVGPDQQRTQTPDSAAVATDEAAETEAAISQRSTGPWGSDPVIVAVSAPSDGRNYTMLVEAATTYWETEDSRYLGYEIDYEVQSNATNPDLIVSFGPEVPGCSGHNEAAGCAPYITDGSQIDRPIEVYIKTGFSNDSTTEIVAHELGHTLGLAHGDEPTRLMNSTSRLYTLPQINATDRPFPWTHTDFAVYIDDSDARDPDGSREQVEQALDYYEDGSEGMPDNLTFRYVSDPADADIAISFTDTSPCGPDAGSCASIGGYDPDGDGALETYDGLRIVLVDLETDAVGWHVGYWVAHYFGAEADSEKPEPFRSATYEERRSEWWA